MEKLIFNYYDMRGYYNFVADIDNRSNFDTGDVERYMIWNSWFLSGSAGGGEEVGTKETNEFVDSLSEICIEDWDNEYLPTSVEDMLTDMPGFRVCYVDANGRMYASQGEVRYAPKEYDKLIYAIAQIDPSASDLLPDVTLGED